MQLKFEKEGTYYTAHISEGNELYSSSFFEKGKGVYSCIQFKIEGTNLKFQKEKNIQLKFQFQKQKVGYSSHVFRRKIGVCSSSLKVKPLEIVYGSSSKISYSSIYRRKNATQFNFL